MNTEKEIRPPKITVVVTCYDLGQFLDEAVDSVLKQTYQDFEIIIVDDGSTDEFTVNLLRDYRKPRTRVIHTANQGLSMARNTGIREANGVYVCCLDADDIYHAEFFEKSLKVLEADEKHELGFVTTWVQLFGVESSVWKTIDYDPYHEAIENRVNGASVFRKECWEKVGGYSAKFRHGYEDWNFWISIIAAGYKWTCIAEPLFFYRQRVGSMRKDADVKKIDIIREILKANRDFYARNAEEIFIKYAQRMHEIGVSCDNALNELKEYHKSVIDERTEYYENVIAERTEYYENVIAERTEYYENAIAERDRELTKKERRLADQEGRIFYLDSLAWAKEKQVQALLDSFSWKITKPARWFFDLIMHGASRTRERLIKLAQKIRGLNKIKKIKNAAWPREKPLISIVIPCFNYGAFAEEAVDSILGQTFQNFEIIVVEGGSTDKTTVEKLKMLHKPRTVVYFREESHLVGDNRNYGIQRASGKYVCCLDADDMLRPTYLEKALFIAESYNYDMVYPSVQLFGERNEVWFAGKTNFLECSRGNNLSTVAVFKREAWEKVKGFKDWGLKQEHVPEDWEFWTRLLGHGYRAQRIEEPLMLYRYHGKGLTASIVMTVDEQKKIIRDANKELFEKSNLKKIERATALIYDVQNPVINLIQQAVPGKKNILFALPFMITGGADTVLLQIAEDLSRNNFRIACVTTEPTEEKMGDNTPRYEKITKEIYHLPRFLEDKDRWKDFIFYLIEAKKIDIVFLVGSAYVYQLLPEIKKRFPGIKVVDQLFNEFGHMKNNRDFSKYIDFNVVASAAIKDALIGRQESEDRIRVITHGVDVDEEFNPALIKKTASAVVPDNKFIVSFFGRFSEEKRPETFVKLIKALKGFDDVFFVMTGHGPLYGEIRKELTRSNLMDKVYLPGFVDDMRPLLARTDVVVIPSRIEGIPIILMEAMSMGVPVVASSVGGIPTVVRNYENGFLCDPEDINPFIDRVTLLHNDAKLRADMSEKARAFAREHFDLAKMKQAYRDVFLKLLA